MKKLFFTLFLISYSCFGFSQTLSHIKEIGLYQTNKKSTFIFDNEMLSPKSADFIGDKLFINALEKGNTIIYSTKTWNKEPSIIHSFINPKILFIKNSLYPILNQSFLGKPVEITHNNKTMWIPYYRLSWDNNSRQGSVIAQVNLSTMEIEQLIPAGSIPKMVKISNNNKILASTHWGDNTIGLYHLINDSVSSFDSVIIEHKLNISNIIGDRDSKCGFCLRGTVFTPDDKYLIIGRMGGGGLAIVDVEQKKYIGTIFNVPSTPRHLILSKDGQTLYLSTVASGQVAKIGMQSIYKDIKSLQDKTKLQIKLEDWKTIKVGSGVRTIALSQDEKFIYAAMNNSSELGVIDNGSMTMKEKYKIASFPVGLAVSNDDKYIAVTAQGKSGLGGGNHVDIFERKQ